MGETSLRTLQRLRTLEELKEEFAGSLENVRGGVDGTVEGEGELGNIGALSAKDGVAAVEVLVFFKVNDNLLSLAHFRALLRPFDDTVRKCRPRGVAVTCSAALLPKEIWITAMAEGTRKWEERKERRVTDLMTWSAADPPSRSGRIWQLLHLAPLTPGNDSIYQFHDAEHDYHLSHAGVKAFSKTKGLGTA